MPEDTAEDEKRGLHEKYEVSKDGEPIEGCFVLEPETDVAARQSLLRYATVTDNDELAADLRDWVTALDGGEDFEPDGYLKFDHANVGYVLDGLEDATVRHNLDRDLTSGDVIELRTPTGRVFAYAVVEAVYESEVRHAYTDMVVSGDRSHPSTGALDLLDRLKGHYPEPELGLETNVDIVLFDVIHHGGAC